MRHLLLHRGLVLLAGLILCLHAVFPHVHASHGASDEVIVLAEQSTSERSFFEALADLVTADLGEEHLEHFTPIDNDLSLVAGGLPLSVFNKQFLPFLGQRLTGPQECRQTIIADHPLLPEEDALFRQRPMRGPPIVG